MKQGSRAVSSSVMTALSIQGPWLKLIQARVPSEGPPTLLGLKARKVEERTEEVFIQALKELVHSLPVAPTEVLGLLSKAEVLTRYLTLPSQNPEELKAMARYQLEGSLPLAIQDCVTSVKIIGQVGEATRVLVAAVLRPNVEQLVRICQQAGLNLTRIAVSSEAIGCWHQACWPTATQGPAPDVWLAVDITKEGLDLGVMLKGSPVYMRQLLHFEGGMEELVGHLQETIQAYLKERIGPSIQQITISGWLEGLGPAPLERLERELGFSVRRVDPLENSPFRESLSVTIQEFSSEISFSELLGAACAPRLLKLDLMPLETRLKQLQQQFLSKVQQTAVLVASVLVLVFGWFGTKVGATWWQYRQTEEQINLLRPQADQIKTMASTVERIAGAQQSYASRLQLIGRAVNSFSSGMSLQFLSLDRDQAITLRGVAPTLEMVTDYAVALHAQKLWKNVLLRSVKVQGENRSSVEFEMLLQPQAEGKAG